MVAVTMLLELNAFMVMNALEVRTVCFVFGIGGDGRRRVGEGGAGGGGYLRLVLECLPACLPARVLYVFRASSEYTCTY